MSVSHPYRGGLGHTGPKDEQKERSHSFQDPLAVRLDPSSHCSTQESVGNKSVLGTPHDPSCSVGDSDTHTLTYSHTHSHLHITHTHTSHTHTSDTHILTYTCHTYTLRQTLTHIIHIHSHTPIETHTHTLTLTYIHTHSLTHTQTGSPTGRPLLVDTVLGSVGFKSEIRFGTLGQGTSDPGLLL